MKVECTTSGERGSAMTFDTAVNQLKIEPGTVIGVCALSGRCQFTTTCNGLKVLRNDGTEAVISSVNLSQNGSLG